MAGPSFISSIKFPKPFVTISCTSVAVVRKLLFHSVRNSSNIPKTLKTYNMGFATVSPKLPCNC